MELALIGFTALLIICFLGVQLAFATLLVGIVGFTYLRGLEPALAMASQQIIEITTNYGLSVIPLFVLMGSLINRAEISDELYDFSNAMMGQFRGGLAMATVLACAGFSAVCGSSLATAATMSRVAMPHMRRYGYADGLSTGALAAGGTLGIMIPPSVPMAIYGIVAEEDIGKLFIAGILPGVLLVSLYLAAVYIRVLIHPGDGPSGERSDRATRLRLLGRTWPVLALFMLVLGGIYLGIFTPTEAGAVGAFGALVFAVSRGRLKTWADIVLTFGEAVRTTAMIFAIGFCALVFSNFINLSGMPFDLLRWVVSMELSPIHLVLIVSLICVALGTVFEAIGILLLIIPVFLPALMAAEVDLIWFGVIVIIVIEMGLITPPIGMNVFTVKSVVTDVALSRMFIGVTPFIVADLIALFLIVLVPGIATLLPNLMH